MASFEEQPGSAVSDKRQAAMTPRFRRDMSDAYEAAIVFGREYDVPHYNLGMADGVTDDLSSCQQRLVERLLGSTPLGEQSTFVDIGSGSGGAAIHVARTRRPKRTVGIDLCEPNLVFSAKRLETAAGVVAPVSFVGGDAHELPLASGFADVVFNLESAFHYPDKDRFVRECRRILKPGGLVLIGDLVSAVKIPRGLTAGQGAFFWSERRYRDALAEAGLRVVSTEDVSSAVYRSIVAALHDVRRSGVRRWWASRRSLKGVIAARAMLRLGLLRYMLFRAAAH